jgi:hypothetical protein
MKHFAGIDVSLEQSSVCVVDTTGKIVREAKVARTGGSGPVFSSTQRYVGRALRTF